ncbi:PIR protein [Plasmodium yoelii]|nr:PIR protein [Plasmodium yoelii]CDU17793.1 YIR protein [Plasmodium yoelii]VTZ78210.1 PIR protein [Plasmodium yoelii]|eukprot:XP_022812098.1 PIR protein [Plasmodium yoelii]
MAISKMCGKFDTFWRFFPDKLKGSEEYEFKSTFFNGYCPNNNCESDINKITAGCLRLFNDMFGNYGSSFDSKTYKDETVCIMIWLGHILSLKSHEGITNLMDFYSKHIEHNTEYTNRKVNDEKYGSYKNVIDQVKEYIDIDISHMPKFYELLKLLCDMNNSYTNENNSKYSEHVNKFAVEYQNLFDDDNNIDNNSYNKVLLVLSKYYNNFEIGRSYKNISIDRPSLPTQKTVKKVNVEGSNGTKTPESSIKTDQSNLVTTTTISNTILPYSSLVNKLIPVLSIVVAIAFFFGISYKYSLFGFRKRSQRQHLREKLKK